MPIDSNVFFRQATLRISSSLKIETAMARCRDYLQGFMPIWGMLFGLYDPELNIARLLATLWPPDLKKPGDSISIPPQSRKRLEAEWAKGPETRVINDIDVEPDEMRQVISMIWPPDLSHLAMDLELENQRLGVFHMFARGKHQYTETHAQLLSLLHEPLAIALSNILKHQEILRLKDLLADDNRFLQRQMLEMAGDTIIGADFGLKDVMQMVAQVAPIKSPVLLMGETGVGKEVIASAVHHASGRNARPFIKVNCGAIPENLMDSELFGHEKGAFTGAVSRKRGRFERAHTGTIFLDEIGDLPPPAQIRLLRVLQQHEIERVGGTETIPVDVRVISATHRNLEQMTRTGKFREDLWFRLNVFPIIIPPLRRRAIDIPALVRYFMGRKAAELKLRTQPPLAPGALQTLQAYDWPGNVRELENLVERALILNQMAGDGGPLHFGPLEKASSLAGRHGPERPQAPIRPLDEVMAEHIHAALDRAGGRVEGRDGAARMLGLHPSTLRGRMRKLKIPHGRGVGN